MRLARGLRTGALILGALAAWGCSAPRFLDPGPEVYASHQDLVLMARWDALAAEEGDRDRSRELINHTHEPQGRWFQEVMRGKKAVRSEAELDRARAYVQEGVDKILKSRQWPAPAAHDVARTTEPARMDGRRDEPAWAAAEAVPIPYPYASPNAIPGAAAACRMLWDDRFLYLFFEVPDATVTSPYTNRDEAVSQADCVELFLLPSDSQATYWEFNIAPTGVIFDSLMSKYRDRWGSQASPDANAAITVATGVDGTLNREGDRDRGYTVEVAVPWAVLPGLEQGPRAGVTFRAMLGWADRAGPDGPLHYHSHTPVLAWFHDVWNYGAFRLK